MTRTTLSILLCPFSSAEKSHVIFLVFLYLSMVLVSIHSQIVAFGNYVCVTTTAKSVITECYRSCNDDLGLPGIGL
jgi:hypothetical protein